MKLDFPQVQSERKWIGKTVSCKLHSAGTKLDDSGSFCTGDLGTVAEVFPIVMPSSTETFACIVTKDGKRFGFLLSDLVEMKLY